MINREKTGARIADLRRCLGLTQSTLAEKLGVTTQAVSKWETGQSLPDIDTLAEMSLLFGMSINSILDSSSLFSAAAPSTGLRSIISSSFDRIESEQVRSQLSAGNLTVEASVTAHFGSRSSSVSVPLDSSEHLSALAPEISQAISGVIDRTSIGLRRIIPHMRCSECGGEFTLSYNDHGGQYLKCSCGSSHELIDGVLDFGGHEIHGERWSQVYRNYQDYLAEKPSAAPEYPDPYYALLWAEIEKRRPRFILDVACGSGIGAGAYISRIDWPCVVVMADLSHRVLKYDRTYFSDKHNPCVDIVYLCCDCAALPFAADTFDVINSLVGFQSMQLKMPDGFREARRILAPTGSILYTQYLISGTANSDKWFELLSQDPDFYRTGLDKDMITAEDWYLSTKDFGLTISAVHPLTDEWPAPDTDKLPFENQMMRWMAAYLMVSEKA